MPAPMAPRDVKGKLLNVLDSILPAAAALSEIVLPACWPFWLIVKVVFVHVPAHAGAAAGAQPVSTGFCSAMLGTGRALELAVVTLPAERANRLMTPLLEIVTAAETHTPTICVTGTLRRPVPSVVLKLMSVEPPLL